MRKIPCEIYSRVVGYFRPVDQYNPGKRAEFNERLEYLVNEEMLNKKIRGRYDKNN
jgi:glucan biosynthesis protein